MPQQYIYRCPDGHITPSLAGWNMGGRANPGSTLSCKQKREDGAACKKQAKLVR